MTPTAAISAFHLYPEPVQAVPDDLIHLESLDLRSRPNGWVIRPHFHDRLNHVFIVGEGGGSMSADTASLTFEAPCLLVIPARVVHAFDWTPDSRGWVLTLATAWLVDVFRRHRELATLAGAARVVPCEAITFCELERDVLRITRELASEVAGRRALIEAGVVQLMVPALREIGARTSNPGACTRAGADLIDRLHGLIELRFRRREPIEVYAAALGVSKSTIYAVCARVSESSPLRLRDDRTLLEAKRALRYSSTSIAQIGFHLGFADAAYFSRFFTLHAGLSPREFRRGASGR